jgi:hypothetical protein
MSGRLGRQTKRNNWSGIRIKIFICDVITPLRDHLRDHLRQKSNEYKKDLSE